MRANGEEVEKEKFMHLELTISVDYKTVVEVNHRIRVGTRMMGDLGLYRWVNLVGLLNRISNVRL